MGSSIIADRTTKAGDARLQRAVLIGRQEKHPHPPAHRQCAAFVEIVRDLHGFASLAVLDRDAHMLRATLV